MSHEILVGMHVTDEDRYASYRRLMTPILESYGGRFIHDFRVSEVLKTDAPHPINRVFVIRFPDQRCKELCFGDESYLQIKKQFFEGSVNGVTILLNC